MPDGKSDIVAAQRAARRSAIMIAVGIFAVALPVTVDRAILWDGVSRGDQAFAALPVDEVPNGGRYEVVPLGAVGTRLIPAQIVRLVDAPVPGPGILPSIEQAFGGALPRTEFAQPMAIVPSVPPAPLGNGMGGPIESGGGGFPPFAMASAPGGFIGIGGTIDCTATGANQQIRPDCKPVSGGDGSTSGASSGGNATSSTSSGGSGSTGGAASSTSTGGSTSGGSSTSGSSTGGGSSTSTSSTSTSASTSGGNVPTSSSTSSTSGGGITSSASGSTSSSGGVATSTSSASSGGNSTSGGGSASGGNAPPPVPEPASWAMMIAGFGIAGLMIRRRIADRAARA